MKKLFYIFYVTLFINTFSVFAQTTDSLSKGNDSIQKAKLSKKQIYGGPRKATIMSAILPGLGQIYNHKVWKVPVIYAGLGGFGYFFYTNNSLYNDYRNALILSQKNTNGTAIAENRVYTTDQLQSQKLYYKKYRDFAIIGMGIIYLINIVDANVDAHLNTFDVSDDLSLQISPYQEMYSLPLMGNKIATGVSLKLNFK